MDNNLKKPKPVSKLKTATIASGIAAVAFGLFFLKFPAILNVAIRSQLNLAEDGPVFPKWSNDPIPVHYRHYFFEVLNPNEALNGAKLSLRERGPYCYKQWRTKRVVKWGPNHETVKYFEYKSWHFWPECSGGNALNDTFVMINPLFGALGEALADMLQEQLPMAAMTSPVVFTMVNSFLDMHQQSLFMRRSVGEVFNGFKINILDTIDTLTGPLKSMGIKLDALPPSPPDNMFGLLYGKNNTPEGPYEIYTGKGTTSSQFGYLVAFKDKTEFPWWGGDFCNKIEGSDGTLFPAGVTKETRLSACAADICRCLSFGYEGDSSYKDIPSYRFGLSLSQDAFASPEKNPNNECFCIHKKKNKRHRCKINGIMDLGGCQSKAPLILSGPHFLDTEPDLSKLVDGLKPDPALHATYVEIEPTSGAPIYGSKKLQISVRVERVPFLRNFQGIRSAYIPFVWVEEEGGLDDKLAEEMKMMLVKPVKAVQSGIFFIAIVSLIVFLALLSLRCFWSAISWILCCFRKGNSIKQVSNSSRVQPKKLEYVTKNASTESNNNITAENSKSVQVKMFYPQPPQIQQRVLLPEPVITSEIQMLNQSVLRVLNETKDVKNQIETDRRMGELRDENRELRQQNRTQLMAQLLQRPQQLQQPTNPIPPAIILNVTPSHSRSSTAVSRQISSAISKVFATANGQPAGRRAIMEPVQTSNVPSHPARAVTSFEDNNKLEDITDDEAEEVEVNELEDDPSTQDDSIQWPGAQVDDGLEQETMNRESHHPLNDVKEAEKKKSGQPFSEWKAEQLGLRTNSVDQEITSISQQLSMKHVDNKARAKSVSIDIPNEMDTIDELLEEPVFRPQITDISFNTPDFGSDKLTTPYRPYFKEETVATN